MLGFKKGCYDIRFKGLGEIRYFFGGGCSSVGCITVGVGKGRLFCLGGGSVLGDCRSRRCIVTVGDIKRGCHNQDGGMLGRRICRVPRIGEKRVEART